MQARRLALPALEQKGRLLLEDVGAAVPLLPDLLARIEAVAQARGVAIPVVAHAGDGNTHPIIVYDAADPESDPTASLTAEASDDLEAAARADERVAALVAGKNVVKVIAIPGRMVNLGVK